jgi:hypothetical protein
LGFGGSGGSSGAGARPQRIRQQFLRHGALLDGSYSASLAAYATVLLGVLSEKISRRGADRTGYHQRRPVQGDLGNVGKIINYQNYQQ